MVSPFSPPVQSLFLVYLSLYGTLVSTYTSVANSSSQVVSPSYPNTTSSSHPNITSSSDVAAASTGGLDIIYLTDSAAVESCNQAWASWVAAQDDVTVFPWFNITPTTISFETVTSYVYSTYKLCDGIPRIVLDGPLNYTTVTIVDDFYTPALSYSYESFLLPSPIVASTFITSNPVISEVGSIPNSILTAIPSALLSVVEEPLPSCQIDLSDCATLLAASSNAMFTGGGINITASPVLWACEDVFLLDTPSSQSGYPCYIEIPIVQLIYWPVTLASQDLCVYPDPIDVTASQPNTSIAVPVASLFGRNFTSDGNCYISYPIAIANFWDGTIETEPGDIIAVPSSELQSFRNSQYGFANFFTYSFNFADLPPNHVPVLAYEGAVDCSIYAQFGEPELNSFCATIYEALYTPQLSFPTELSKKFPRWASCDFNFLGLYDPPTSLVPIDFLTPPSTASLTATAASPGLTGDPATPSITPVEVQQESSPTIAPPVRSSANAIDSDPPSESNGYSSIDSSDPPANTEPPLETVVTFGHSDGSVAVSLSSTDVVVVGSATVFPGQVATIDGQAVSVLSQGLGLVVGGSSTVLPGQVATIDGQAVPVLFQGLGVVELADGSANPSDPATAVFTLGDGNVVTATSIASGYIVVGSQTLTTGQAFTTDGAVLSVVDGGLLLSSAAFEGAGEIITVNSKTLTVHESVNSQGSTVIDVGGTAITLSSGVEILSIGVGVVITGSRGITTVLFSTMTTDTSTPLQSSTSSRPTTAIAVTSTSKKNGSSRVGIGTGVLVIGLFVALGLFSPS